MALQRKSRLMSSAERGFYETLMAALADDYYVFTRVRVLDVVEPTPGLNWIKAKRLNKLLAEQFLDFVICRQRDMSIFGLVELERFDTSGGKKVDSEREALIAEICKTANLKLFYFDLRQDYQHMDMRRLITGRAARAEEDNSPTQQSQLTIDGTSADFAKMRLCPKCNSEIVTKVAVRGEHIGEKFLMCRKYPYCDFQVSVRDAKLRKLEARLKNKDAKPGYSDWSAG